MEKGVDIEMKKRLRQIEVKTWQVKNLVLRKKISLLFDSIPDFNSLESNNFWANSEQSFSIIWQRLTSPNYQISDN